MASEELIPSGAFVPVEPLTGNPWASSSYASNMATDVLIAMAVTYLGISPYQLGRLLGYKNRSHIYTLLAGRRRPGQLYVARLAWLLWLRSQGAEPMRWREINWEAGVVTMKTAPRRPVGSGV